jgi:hypothetical protein
VEGIGRDQVGEDGSVLIQALVHDMTLAIDGYELCQESRRAMMAARELLIKRREEILAGLENVEH